MSYFNNSYRIFILVVFQFYLLLICTFLSTYDMSMSGDFNGKFTWNLIEEWDSAVLYILS